MYENFPTYIKNVVEEDPYSILNELQKRQHYKPKGRPPFSALCLITSGKISITIFFFIRKNPKWWCGIHYSGKITLGKGSSFSGLCFIS